MIPMNFDMLLLRITVPVDCIRTVLVFSVRVSIENTNDAKYI